MSSAQIEDWLKERYPTINVGGSTIRAYVSEIRDITVSENAGDIILTGHALEKQHLKQAQGAGLNWLAPFHREGRPLFASFDTASEF